MQPPNDAERPVRQVGALPYWVKNGALLLVIITSRRTRRWICPKGNLDPGVDLRDMVATEAFEEAGVLGDVAIRPIGRYRGQKILPDRTYPLEVSLYPLRVTKFLDEWPEIAERERRVVDIETAIELLAQPCMTALVEKLQRDHDRLEF